MAFVFSKRSRNNLKGVHPDLIKVMERALQLTTKDFTITEGVRTYTRQVQLKRQGLTQTLNSKHLRQLDGYGHAIDLVPYPVSWKLEDFYPIVKAVQKAAEELKINVRWGGSWDVLNNQGKSPKQLVEAYSANKRKLGQKVFIDAPHFEIVK